MSKISDVFEELKQKRDELKVQIHLGSLEAKEEWDELEAKWDKFAAEAELEKTGEGISEAMKSLGHELKQGYERLKQAF